MRTVKEWVYRNYFISCQMADNGGKGGLRVTGRGASCWFAWQFKPRWPHWFWGQETIEGAIKDACQWIDADILREVEVIEQISATRERIDATEDMEAAQREIEALLA